MQHDLLSDVFASIKNADLIGKHSCTTKANGLVREVLKVMQDHSYIGAFEFTEDGKSGTFSISLNGKINDCGAIRPRFSVGKRDFIDWEKRFLPANKVGILIISTAKGIMDQRKAEQLEVGGKLLGYVY
ncbi:MAG: 30S ribosomal protein S8 [Nanoarchaeota archaeon]|nr:30S ribosomal protein S8 [Nanoarchaeota archaeon]